MNRRGFLMGVAGFLAAPAIVRAGSLMPVKTFTDEMNFELLLAADDTYDIGCSGRTLVQVTKDGAMLWRDAANTMVLRNGWEQDARDRRAWLAHREAALKIFGTEPN